MSLQPTTVDASLARGLPGERIKVLVLAHARVIDGDHAGSSRPPI